MSTRLAHYSPEDVNVLIAGILNLDGFAEGTFVSIAKESPIFTHRESADGVVARARIDSKLYTVTVTLASTSSSNESLSYLSRLDEITGLGKFPLLIKDISGKSLFFSPESWIETIPVADYSDTVEVRNWDIVCSNAVMFVAGNYDESGFLEDLLNIGSGYLGGVV